MSIVFWILSAFSFQPALAFSTKIHALLNNESLANELSGRGKLVSRSIQSTSTKALIFVQTTAYTQNDGLPLSLSINVDGKKLSQVSYQSVKRYYYQPISINASVVTFEKPGNHRIDFIFGNDTFTDKNCFISATLIEN